MNDAVALVVRLNPVAGAQLNTRPAWCLLCVTDGAEPVLVSESYSRDDEVYDNLREISSRGRYSAFTSAVFPKEGAEDLYPDHGLR